MPSAYSPAHRDKKQNSAHADIGGLMAELTSRPQITEKQRELTGPERAAVLMLSLGEQYGAKIFSLLDEPPLTSMLASSLIERRLADSGVNPNTFQVVGRPTDLAGARDLARRDKHQFQWWAAWRIGARWYREEKKGADRGIDGRMMFKNGPYGDGLIIISVKGGDNVGVQMVRDLRGVIERESAEMGIVVCLAEPTAPMKSEATAAGFVSKSAHGRLPRLQVVTIGDILDGRMPKLPPLPQPERFERRAPRKQFKDQLELLLPFAGDKVGPTAGDFIDPSIMASTAASSRK